MLGKVILKDGRVIKNLSELEMGEAGIALTSDDAYVRLSNNGTLTKVFLLCGGQAAGRTSIISQINSDVKVVLLPPGTKFEFTL